MASNEFRAKAFWAKCGKAAGVAGTEVLRKALWLFYAFPAAPLPAKGIIGSALGYFIVPFDAVPEALLGPAGYPDDLAVIAAAVGAVAFCIDKDVKRKADEKLKDWGLS